MDVINLCPSDKGEVVTPRTRSCGLGREPLLQSRQQYAVIPDAFYAGFHAGLC